MDSNSVSPTNGDPFTAPTSVSGNVNSRLLPPSGPSPHLILKTSEIRIQRLEKRIRKLIEQRDHYKDRVKLLTEMLTLYPFIMNRWEDYQKRKADVQRLRDYDKLVPLLEYENDRLKAENEALKKTS